MKRTIITLKDREKALKIIADLYSEAEDLRDDANDKEAEAATWENAVEYFDNYKDEGVLERLREGFKAGAAFAQSEQKEAE
jgi:transposase